MFTSVVILLKLGLIHKLEYLKQEISYRYNLAIWLYLKPKVKTDIQKSINFNITHIGTSQPSFL